MNLKAWIKWWGIIAFSVLVGIIAAKALQQNLLNEAIHSITEANAIIIDQTGMALRGEEYDMPKLRSALKFAAEWSDECTREHKTDLVEKESVFLYYIYKALSESRVVPKKDMQT